ncbi:hypothetical protein DPMN_091665 [Dreissena polymorpha]|uniref:ABC transporter domain-containing protein n=1 Tax=Dreissena polymorpha TaxID=45954 RepID=A0A9D4QZG1_DREPO|nr:hypothetical protein DPMN_091665 [Dreissena polymorpha]
MCSFRIILQSSQTIISHHFASFPSHHRLSFPSHHRSFCSHHRSFPSHHRLMSNLDNRISNPDQLLTTDVDKFCDTVAELYSNLSKFIKAVHKNDGEQKLEGEYRYVNSRIITNSEEVAFYQGNVKEKTIIFATFEKLVNHMRYFIFFRLQMGLVDNIIAKYFATVIGYLVVSRPFLNLANPKYVESSHSQRLEDYYKSGRMLVRMAEAIGRIVLAGREMTRLSGFTARITELMTVLDDLNNGKYERTMVTDRNHKDSEKAKVDFKPGSGKMVFQDHIIKFDKVPLVTPNGDVLVKELNFEVKSGVNVLVCGPNGSGKSSLFRILGELWPLFGGTLTKPKKGNLFYVPQRPYMTVGTLRDQVIYPDSVEDQKRRNVKDSELADILEKVQLGYILDREKGWESVQDWMDVLSGGEKQRIAVRQQTCV